MDFAALNTIAAFWLLFLLLPPGLAQHYYTNKPIYIAQEPPRLRRLEYGAAPSLLYQQQVPNFQLLNYRPSYTTQPDYEQHTLTPFGTPPPAIYSQQRAPTPYGAAELAKYRYEGNYLQRLPAPTTAQLAYAQQTQRRAEEQLYNVPPALFTSNVLHVVPRSARQQQSTLLQRPRRYTNTPDSLTAESRKVAAKPDSTRRYYHDIFMRFAARDKRSHGHVLQQPDAQQQRFEQQSGTNRYKGEVIWTDRQGGHGEHRWNLAQGKLN